MSNENIELLRSNPKNSLLKLAIPIMVTMIVTSLYNVIDGVWIAGLGKNAIAGVGITIPLWMIINGLSSGLANGATSSISRFRAESDEKANMAGEQSIIIFFLASVILSIILIVVLLPFLDLYNLNEAVYNESINYSLPLFMGLITFVFSNGLAAILRAEGDTKRAMYAMTLGIILNAVFDPVFIYLFNMGSAGAAVSTIFTSFISAAIIFYWVFIKKDTYIKLNTKNIIKLKLNFEIANDILKTGIPASFVLFMLSFASFVFYYFISITGGTLGIGVYSSGNRLYLLGIMPLSAMCSAFVAVVGTQFGDKNIEYLKIAHNYCCLYSLIFGIVAMILFIIFSDQLAYIFVLSTNDIQLVQGISTFVKYTSLCFPFLAIGLPSTYWYQGLGRGLPSLFCTTFSEVICTIPATYIFAFIFNYGLIGIWMGFIVGRGFASIINYFIAKYSIKNLEKEFLT